MIGLKLAASAGIGALPQAPPPAAAVVVVGEVLSDALSAFAGYHTHPVLVAGATDLVLGDTRLIFYYQNRLAAHGFAYDAIAPKSRAA